MFLNSVASLMLLPEASMFLNQVASLMLPMSWTISDTVVTLMLSRYLGEKMRMQGLERKMEF